MKKRIISILLVATMIFQQENVVVTAEDNADVLLIEDNSVVDQGSVDNESVIDVDDFVENGEICDDIKDTEIYDDLDQEDNQMENGGIIIEGDEIIIEGDEDWEEDFSTGEVIQEDELPSMMDSLYEEDAMVDSADMVLLAEAPTSGVCGDNLTWCLIENEEDEYLTLIIDGTGNMYDYSEGIQSTQPWAPYSSKIKSITIANGVTSIGNSAFYNCMYLESIEIPDGVTSIGQRAFACSGIPSIKIPDSVMSMGSGIFAGCLRLRQIELPKEMTSIGETAFYGCTNLTSVKLPKGITSIEDSTFRMCMNLTSIELPEEINSIGNKAFNSCSALKSITIPNQVTSLGDSCFDSCSSLESIIMPKNLTSIGDSCFVYCHKLTYINMPEKITSIGNDAFYGCSALKSITIPNQVTSIGNNAFKYCYNLLDVIIPNGVTELNEGTFYNCSRLTSIEILGGVTSIGNDAFSGCSALKNITIPNQVTSIGNNAFKNCCNLLNVIIPNGVTELNEGTFYNCSRLTSIEIPEGVTSIGNDAFSGCSALQNITIPNQVTSIGNNAFKDCCNLLNVIIPNGVTELNEGTFYNCSSLTSIKVPEGVTIVGEECFAYCKDLTVSFPKTVESIASTAFANSTNVTICGYRGSYAETYAMEKNITFVNLSGDVVVPDYDYSEKLNRWILAKGTANSMEYLARDSNFINSLLIANSDSSFSSHVVETMANMYFRGIDGWKEIIYGDTSKDEAIEIITALMGLYEEEIEEYSMAETAKKFAGIYVSTLKQADWAYAVEYGLSSEEINQLAKVCNSENLSKFFLESKYDSISHYLEHVGGYSENSNVIKCIDQFSESKELTKTLSDNLKYLGYGLDIIKIGSDSIKRYYDIMAMANADEIYLDMLQYLSENCELSAVRQAANEMYQVMNNECVAQLAYLCDPALEKVEDFVFDQILTKVAESIPMGAIVYKSFKYSTGLANIFFHTADSQKQKINMRCVAYIGDCLSEWMQVNKNLYLLVNEKDKNIYAKKTVFSYYMLLKTRMAGEESTRKYLELIRAPWKKEYTVSLEITSALESMERMIKYEGVLDSFKNSVIACPVNVEVYDQFGNLVLTMYDGEEDSGYVDEIYYSVIYHPLEQDYVKIVNYPEKGGYNFKCTATDLGKVDFYTSSIADDGAVQRKEVRDIPILQGSEIEITNISQENPSCKLIDQGDVVKEYVVQPEKREYVSVEKIVADLNSMKLKVGEKSLINIQILPDNATSRDVIWKSGDESVAKVNSDGVIEGVGIGETIITALSVENEDVSLKVAVTVNNNAINHIWNEEYTIDLKPTCISEGKKSIHCSVCDTIKEGSSQSIPAAGHSWNNGKVITEATCTNAGEKTYTCTVCGGSRKETISAAGHQWKKDYSIDKGATCTEEGEKSIHCSVCDTIKEGSSQSIPVAGHSWDNGKVRKEATCTEEGEKTYICTECNFAKKEVIAANGHQWSTWKIINEATVFAPKNETRTCNSCKKEENRTVGNVLSPTVALNYANLVLKVGQSTNVVKVSGLANGDSVQSWKSSNTKIVKVDNRGRITAQKKTGKANVIVTLANPQHTTVKIQITVQKSAVKTKRLEGLQKNIVLQKGQTIVLRPVRNPITSLERMTYKSSNKKVVTVNSKGQLKAVRSGKTSVTVKCGSAKYVIKVSVPKTKTTAINNIPQSIKLKKGKKYTLKAKLTPGNSDEKVLYKTSNKKVATVNAKGVVTGVKKGKTVITIVSGSKSVKCEVTVK